MRSSWWPLKKSLVRSCPSARQRLDRGWGGEELGDGEVGQRGDGPTY